MKLNAICAPELDPLLEEKNAIKDIIGIIDAVGIWTVDKSTVSVLNFQNMLCMRISYS